ncbi:hypothetical protein SAMN02745883_01277 [Caminicella sporogenes DSM 14501]|uniref:Uncharacterized protein n=1 Tax=Caminicella sporogenes DSM 14501 TaxID=1121266 RepID=A0A1M6PRI7_9FIRM|nr:hypothetical protein [Caminicella sporogenes]RKD22004.1 hypothetical protein BET04_07070 [Caminicella sporogenes]WIF96035.1 hypothetical protein QNI18_05560 [Caminicella sporogenes]SHK10547.1 hypothetical protein SAMN02745883_01277 [Caminicella sporogenes DSM 14501]
MDDKTFELLEKLYVEFIKFKEEMMEFKEEMTEFKEEMIGFKEEMTEFKEEMVGFKEEMTEFKEEMIGFKGDMTEFKEEMVDFKEEMTEYKKDTNGRLIRLEIAIEEIRDKATEALEAFEVLSETNKKQHEEIMRELKGEISVIELAVKRKAT